MNNQRGITAVELLVYLLLLSLSAFLAMPTIKQHIALRQRQKTREDGSTAVEALSRLLPERIINGLECCGLETARIHTAGKIYDGFHTLNPVHSGSMALRPNHNSDAITFLRLTPENALRVVERAEQASTSLKVTLCFANMLPTPQLDDDTYFIGLGPDGAVEASGALDSGISSDPRCLGGRIYNGTLTARQGSMFEPVSLVGSTETNMLLKQSLIFIPIAEHYTIYIDTNGSLRRLSHTTQENQPTYFHFGALRISLQNESARARVYFLEHLTSDLRPAGLQLLVQSRTVTENILNTVM